MLAALAMVALGAASCREEAPADKVLRWATEIMPTPAAAAAEADVPGEAAAAPAALEADTGPRAGAEGACARLVDAACEHLGVYSEECSEARTILPGDETPEQRLACAEVLARRLGPEAEASGVNPCRLLERARCEEAGPRTWACREARADAARLRRQRRERVCLGDLLAWEARRILSGSASGTGR